MKKRKRSVADNFQPVFEAMCHAVYCGPEMASEYPATDAKILRREMDYGQFRLRRRNRVTRLPLFHLNGYKILRNRKIPARCSKASRQLAIEAIKCKRGNNCNAWIRKNFPGLLPE